MKQAVNFRLDNRSMAILSILESKLHVSKTAIVENALQVYAKSYVSKNPLLRFAGILSNQEADDMLHTIKTKKHNKDIQVDL